MGFMGGRMKICLVASAGGHLTQLRKMSKAWSGREACWITTTDVAREMLSKDGKVFTVGECNREHLVRVFRVLIRSIRIIMKERPDVVISTGAAVGAMMCFLGKMLGAKIVWVDSITNVERLSLSGRLVRPFADLFLVQWPELTKKYSRLEYAGTVI